MRVHPAIAALSLASLMLLTAGPAHAHQPVVVDSETTEVVDPEISKAYYGVLAGAAQHGIGEQLTPGPLRKDQHQRPAAAEVVVPRPAFGPFLLLGKVADGGDLPGQIAEDGAVLGRDIHDGAPFNPRPD